MASVSNDPNGRRRILFVAPDGRRKAIRLGKISSKQAETIKTHVEELLAARISGQPVGRQTALWLAEVGADLHDKLASAGLVASQQRLTVQEYLATWLAGKQASGYAVASIVAWGQACKEVSDLFGERLLADLSHADGIAVRDAMKARGLALTTVHRRITHARQALEDAVRLGHIDKNPFVHVRQQQGDPSERRAYVSVGDVDQVLEKCPNVWWRLLVALARFGGLRTPSEPFSLQWEHIDWERNRLTIISPKTRGKGKGHRILPLFPLLRPHLEAAFEFAEEESVFIFPDEYRRRAMGPRGWANANLRTTLKKIILRAGVDSWPRLWHSLRASCESDLANAFPLPVVTKWMGNTPSVALRHYVDPTEAAFEAAQNWQPGRPAFQGGAESGARVAQNPAQQGSASARTGQQDSP